MKARYTLHVDEGYIESEFEGAVTLVEIGLHIQQVWADPAWNPAFSGIMDFSRASVELSDDEIKSLMKSMVRDPRCSFAKWAIVVSTADDFKVFRKADGAMEQPSTLRIFFSRAEAIRWLLQPQARKPKDKPE